MRFLLLILFLFPGINLNAQENDLIKLRDSYYEAAFNHDLAKQFYDELQPVKREEIVKFGYKGMASLLLASHSYNPVAKFNYFLEGKKILEMAITHSPQNVELLYLRFTVQTNTPAFLKYQKDIKNDKEFLLEALKNGRISDVDLEARIHKYLLETKYCSSRDKKTLSQMNLTARKEM